MQLRAIQYIVFLGLTLFSLSMMPPAVIALAQGEDTGFVFLACGLVLAAIGVGGWLPVRNRPVELRLRDGFLVVVALWGAIGLAGMVPFLFTPGLAPMDALFESVSGLTTTGATVIPGLDELPRSTLFYRQQLQWIGGMGVIVLAAAIMPMLGIGGMQLYRAWTPGPMKYNKLSARLAQSARGLWYVYLGFTVACALGYWLAGMTLFDAVAHAMSTVSLGGFSTHDANFAWFGSPAIEAVAVAFMLLAGVNFALHFLVWRGGTLRPYRESAELKAYLLFLAFVASLTVLSLAMTAFEFTYAARHGIFAAVSMMVTAGFTSTDHHLWPLFVPLLLLMASFVGGCAGSPAGGLKVFRVLLLMKQVGREVRRLVHPNAAFFIRIGNQDANAEVIDAVWGYFSLYMFSFVAMTVVLNMSGMDMVTAFSAVAACINNLGPGLGEVAHDYAELDGGAKAILCAAMLIGRLEIFTLLLLLTPGFWRK
ncbi:MAG: potassium transporter TrkG [Gammaproteobacteria bacterium]|jgi:trk system potassium uptake protein TrkH|nr:potassium transporter TrkG [Gammaproteobacteria bacterium]